MNLFVDTSVWSLAWRRDAPPDLPEVELLSDALRSEDALYTTGLVLQELLQGFHGAKAKQRIIHELSALPFIVPDRDDHVRAAELRNGCRRKGVQVGTIDALLAQLCIRHGLKLLTTDADFRRLAEHAPLALATR
jgi:hypothetical protein